MAKASAVAPKEAAGAPEAEIVVTAGMIEAGAEKIWGFFDEVIAWGSVSGRELALSVFLAMIHRSHSSVSK